MILFGDKGTLAFELDPLAGPPADGDPSAAATWAKLLIWVDGRNIALHVHTNREVPPCAGLHWPVIYLARWLVRSWPRLFEQQVWPIPGTYRNARSVCQELDRRLVQLEEDAERGAISEEELDLYAERRDDFVQSHSLVAGMGGGLCPNMYLARDGSRVSIAVDDRVAHPSVQFLGGRHEIDLDASRFLDAVRGLIGWTLGKVRAVDAPTCAEDRELFSSWLSGLEEPVAAEAALFGYLGIAPADLEGVLSSSMDATPETGSLRMRDLTQLFELESNWWENGAGFDASRSGVAMVFRALSPTLTPETIVSIVRKLRAYPRNVRADEKLRKSRGNLPQKMGREKDYEHGYRLAMVFRDIIGNRDGYFDIEAWLRTSGIAIEELSIPDPDVDGGAVWDDEHGPVVLVNPTSRRASTPWGRRMVLAHELCHLLIDRDFAVPLKVMSGDWAPPLLERRANTFAAELLLPRAGIVAQIGTPSTLPDDSTLTRLMDVFEVGETACVAHLQNRFRLDRWGREYRRKPPTDPIRATSAQGLKALLLSMPDVGEDADFARPVDHGRSDEPWDS